MRLSSINGHEDGRSVQVYPEGPDISSDIQSRVEYYHKDHLGNVRLSFSDLDQDGSIMVGSIYDPGNEITLEKHYYPFGMDQTGAWFGTVAPGSQYNYNGKELDEATGWYDYGARYYDPAIARWGQVDPLAEDYAPISPYVYTANNPIRYIDPDGMRIGEGQDKVDQVKNYITSAIAVSASKAANHIAKASQARSEGKDGRAARQDRRANRQIARIDALKNASAEIQALEDSDVTYNLITSDSQVSDGASAVTTYNTTNESVDIYFNSKTPIADIGHELKHAFQYETGGLSFGADGRRGGNLYDATDEVEAYQRGHLLGDSRKGSLRYVKSNYRSIRKRTTPLSMGSPTSIDGVTVGSQMRNKMMNNGLRGRAPGQYYRNWRKDYGYSITGK